VIYDDLMIVSCDGNDVQFVVALDKLTGKVRWQKVREGYQAYTTPLVVSLAEGDQVISPGAFRAVAYDPRTGKEIWQVKYGEGFSNVPRPVYGHGLVFICTGFQQASLLAVRPDGRGDVTKSKVAWRLDRGVPLTPSPLLVGDELYMVTDNGIAPRCPAHHADTLQKIKKAVHIQPPTLEYVCLIIRALVVSGDGMKQLIGAAGGNSLPRVYKSRALRALVNGPPCRFNGVNNRIRASLR
jgi:PQQ-like domain